MGKSFSRLFGNSSNLEHKYRLTEEENDCYKYVIDIYKINKSRKRQPLVKEHTPSIGSNELAKKVEEAAEISGFNFAPRPTLIDYSIFSPDEAGRLGIKDLVVDFETSIFANNCTVVDRALGCLIGMAIGDSWGAPLEFTPVQYGGERIIKSLNKDYHFKPGVCNKFRIKPGQYTDDTAMGLCLADTLLVHGQVDLLDLKKRFVMWWYLGYNNAFKNDTSARANKMSQGRSVGLGGQISFALHEFKDDPTKTFMLSDPQLSGNGSIMRLAPVSIFHVGEEDPHSMLEGAILQSYSTHSGIEAADCCVLLSFLLYKAMRYRHNDAGADIAEELKNARYLKSKFEAPFKAPFSTPVQSADSTKDDHDTGLENILAIKINVNMEKADELIQNATEEEIHNELDGAVTCHSPKLHKEQLNEEKLDKQNWQAEKSPSVKSDQLKEKKSMAQDFLDFVLSDPDTLDLMLGKKGEPAATPYQLKSETVGCILQSKQRSEYEKNEFNICDRDQYWNWKDPQFRFSPTREVINPGYVGGYACDNLAMALHSVYHTSSFEEAILYCVNRGGDADTVGSVTGQIAGALYGVTSIPKEALECVMQWDNEEIGLRAIKLLH